MDSGAGRCRLTGSVAAIILLSFYPGLSAAESVTVSIRGKSQTLVSVSPDHTGGGAIVIFLPGDGGWRGAAVSMAKKISSWGYCVYGFDTRGYLESYSQDGLQLSQAQLAEDMRLLAERARGSSGGPVILVGWSQGAGMAVAAVSGRTTRSPVHGVITLGMPESVVLGWDWKATMAVLMRREPDQPSFLVKPLLRNLAPTPVWMIHGLEDEYTRPEIERALFNVTSEPKKLSEIEGANHKFEGRQDKLYESLQAGLRWVISK